MKIKIDPTLSKDLEEQTDAFTRRRQILHLLETLVEFNRRDIREGKGFEQRATSPDLIDNENTTLWRCAELCEQGIAAKPYITWKHLPDGSTLYQVKILMPDGTVRE